MIFYLNNFIVYLIQKLNACLIILMLDVGFGGDVVGLNSSFGVGLTNDNFGVDLPAIIWNLKFNICQCAYISGC